MKKASIKLLIPFIGIALIYFPCYYSNEFLIQSAKEDGFYESAGALFFLFSAIGFFILAFKPKFYKVLNNSGKYLEGYYFLLLALLFFFAFGEEISWGQRIFNFDTPQALEDINVQKEFNIHNIELFHGKTLDGEEKTGIYALLEMHKLFYMAFFGYLFIIPLMYRLNSKFRTLINTIRLPVPPIIFGLLFGFNLIYGHFVKQLLNSPVVDVNHGVVEIKETIIALILFVLPFYWIKKK